jgi:hypothetical chaperone protein
MSAPLILDRIGIDFGTSNTVASVFARTADAANRVVHQALRLDLGPVLKSLLYFPNTREAFFGREAIEQYFDREREGRFFQSIKRLLPNPEFQGTQLGGRFVSLESLIARFLSEVKKRIEAELAQPISEVRVIFGRPARYSLDEEREKLATRRFRAAIEQSGFKNYALLEEPTAASRATGSSSAGITLVADLGGGTSDFTVLQDQKVLAVYGVPLAGDALDSAFVSEKLLPFFGSEVTYQRPFSSNVLTFPKSLISRIPKWHQHVILKEKSNWNFMLGLRNELVEPSDLQYLENLLTLVDENLGYSMHQKVELLKIAASAPGFSEGPESGVLPFVFQSHPIDIQLEVSRSAYEQVLRPIVARIEEAARHTLGLAGVSPAEITRLAFTGGTAQVPQLRRAIRSSVPHAQVEDQESFTAVAMGLSVSDF